MPDNVNEIKYRIIRLKNLIKLPTGNFSEEDDNFIKETIIRFRESMIDLSRAKKDEFEEKAKNYKKNLNGLIATMEGLLQFIKSKYTGNYKKTAWNR